MLKCFFSCTAFMLYSQEVKVTINTFWNEMKRKYPGFDMNTIPIQTFARLNFKF